MASTGRSGGTAGLSPLSAAPIRAACQNEESPVYQPNQPDGRKPHDDAADYLAAPIPALPHHLHRFPRLTDCRRDLALADLIQIPRRFPHWILVMLLMLNCWRELPAAGENWRQIAQGLSISHEWRTTFGLVMSVLSSITSLVR